MPATYSDVLLVGGVPNQWIKLVSNGIAQTQGTAYVSDAVTTFPSSTQGGGVFSFATGPPADIYTVWTLSGSLSSTQPASGDTRWVATGNINYVVAYTAGDAASLKSGTYKSSSPNTNTANTGGMDVSGRLRQVMPIKDDGVTDNHDAILAWIAANIPNGGVVDLSGYAGPIATSPLDLPAYTNLRLPLPIDTEDNYSSPNIPRLIPFAAGQAYVVRILNKGCSLSGFIDALSNNNANAAQHAVQAEKGFTFNRLLLTGGTLSTLYGTSTAVQVVGSDLHIWAMDTIGGVKPIDNVGSDWQITNGRTDGTGPCSLAGAFSRWIGCHFVIAGPTGVHGAAPLITDGGRQHFIGCYFDGTPGTAMIDRSAAGDRSTYFGCSYLQSIAGVTGIPLFKEHASKGAIIVGGFVANQGAGSSFTNFIDAPNTQTVIAFIECQGGIFTAASGFSGTIPTTGPFMGLNLGDGNNPSGAPVTLKAVAPTIGATATINPLVFFTTPNDGQIHYYRVFGWVTITTLGSGNFKLQVAYTDSGGTSHGGCIVPLVAQAGTDTTAASTLDDYKGEVLIACAPNTTINLYTTGTFTGCTYNAGGSLEQLR